MENRATLTIPANVEHIPQLMEFVDTFLEQKDCPMKVQMQIDVAIDEIFSNVCFYAYQNNNGECTIEIEVRDTPSGIVVSFIDSGVPYNPLEHEDPDISLPLEERGIGGLGILMVKKTMDEVSYEYKKDQNIFKICKNF